MEFMCGSVKKALESPRNGRFILELNHSSISFRYAVTLGDSEDSGSEVIRLYKVFQIYLTNSPSNTIQVLHILILLSLPLIYKSSIANPKDL